MILNNIPEVILRIIYKFLDYPNAIIFSLTNSKMKKLFDILDNKTLYSNVESYNDLQILKNNIINNCRYIKISENIIGKIVNVKFNYLAESFTIICKEGYCIEVWNAIKDLFTLITLRNNTWKTYKLKKFKIITSSYFINKCNPISKLIEQCYQANPYDNI